MVEGIEKRAGAGKSARGGGPVGSSPAIAGDGTSYVGCEDGILYAVGPNGEQRWSFRTGGSILSSPAVAASRRVRTAIVPGPVIASRAFTTRFITTCWICAESTVTAGRSPARS